MAIEEASAQVVDRQIILTRRFDAPRELVYRACTDEGGTQTLDRLAAFLSQT